MRWPNLKGQGWRSYGRPHGREVVGTLDLKDLSMIGSWRWFSASFIQLARKESAFRLGIGYFGRKLRMESSL